MRPTLFLDLASSIGISEHGAASDELAHAHISVYAATQRDVPLIISVRQQTLRALIDGVHVISVTASSRSSVGLILKLLKIHPDTTTVWWLHVLLLHPTTESLLALYWILGAWH